MRLYLSLFSAICALSFAFNIGCGGNTQADIKLNQPVQFTIKTYDGGVVTPAQYMGRVLIVDYWATWCAPCRAEFPHFKKLLETYGDDLAIVAVTVDEDKRALDNFMADNKLPFLVGLAADSSTPSWGKTPPAMPTTFYIDRDGILVSFGKGKHSYDELNAIVKPLIDKPATITNGAPAEPGKEPPEPSEGPKPEEKQGSE